MIENMNDIIDSIKKVSSVSEDTKKLDQFSREEYNKKFKNLKPNDGWHDYKGFKILSENSIRIDYSYGGGDMEFDDFFIVNL